MENKIILTFKNNKLLLNIDTNKLNFNDIKGKLISLKEGEVIFKQGDPSDFLYLIINGKIKVIDNRQENAATSITLNLTDFLGHLDLYESPTRKTTAIALEDSYLIAVSKAELNSLLWQDPNILINLKTYCGFDVIQPKKESKIVEEKKEDQIYTETVSTEFNNYEIKLDEEQEFNLNLVEEKNDISNIDVTEDNLNLDLTINEIETNIEITPLEDTTINLDIDLSNLPEFIDNEEPENLEIKYNDDLALGTFRTSTFYEDETVINNTNNIETNNTEPSFSFTDNINLDNVFEDNSPKIEQDFNNNLNLDEELNLTTNDEELNINTTNIDEFNLNISEDPLTIDLNFDKLDSEIETISFTQENEPIETLSTANENEFNFDFKFDEIEAKNEEPIKFESENEESTSSLVEEYLKQFENTSINEEVPIITEENFKITFEAEDDIKPEGEITDDFDKEEFLKNEFEEFNLDIEANKVTDEESTIQTNFEENEIKEELEPIKEEDVSNNVSIKDNEELRKQGVMNIEQLQMILKAAQLVSSKIKLDDVLQNIVSVATGITNADRGTLYLVDKEKGELWSKVVMGNELKEIRLKIGDGIAGWVAKTGEIVNIKDVQSDSRFQASFDKSSGYVTKTMICFPIKNPEGEIIGVHQLLNSKNGEFSKLDEAFLNAISIHAAIALENAELVEKLLQMERISSLGKMANFLIQDIKNPILTSKRYAEHLKTKNLPEDAQKTISLLVDQLNQVADLVLTTSNYSEKNKVLRQINTDLVSVIKDYNSRLDQLVKKKNCKIETKFDLNVLVRVDVKEFYQAYQHVIKNAMDAMPDGGTVTVTTKKEGPYINLLISDTGIGIPDTIKDKIFDPFMSYGKKEGTGLGLSIAKKIIEEHSGSITFESVLDKGTTFIIKLPIAQDL